MSSLFISICYIFFFFQAEDGIRDGHVTGVQTCALPIWENDLIKLDMLINGDPVDAFSVIIHQDKAYEYGREVAKKLRELIPRQLFDVAIQATIGNRIIARETIRAKIGRAHV